MSEHYTLGGDKLDELVKCLQWAMRRINSKCPHKASEGDAELYQFARAQGAIREYLIAFKENRDAPAKHEQTIRSLKAKLTKAAVQIEERDYRIALLESELASGNSFTEEELVGLVMENPFYDEEHVRIHLRDFLAKRSNRP